MDTGACRLDEANDGHTAEASPRTPFGEGMMTIGDVSRRMNVTPRALRLYENEGLIASYRLGSWRYYDASVMARLALVLRLKSCDFSLQQIKSILDSNCQPGGNELALPQSLIEDQIERLQSVKSRVDRAIHDLSSMMQSA
jgi:DNA-binding transcriptional MerR regulator